MAQVYHYSRVLRIGMNSIVTEINFARSVTDHIATVEMKHIQIIISSIFDQIARNTSRIILF